MKKFFYLTAIMTMLVFAWSANVLAADKIGFINLQEIMQTSNAGKKAADEFKRFYEKETQEIKSMENQLKKMKDELEKQGSVLTQSSRSEKEAAYQKKMRDYQLLVNDTNEELKKRDQEMTQKLMPGIIKIVRSIAEREKYTLVIDVATMPIPYYAKENDFSNKVIEEFNKTK
ncbi:MAG TPA: OmpH family outer membrane protein [Smithella sp.]|jgi:outer membrane protein|nr:OmpH family outer membrane protein [Smithella sp.]NMC96328.1 OmpH family outer membrane protein [Deltaproteobacteria bacterium]OQC51426.1 MAG: periplasmic chaperone [Deltaproteobacteria bacterium ADurb.Bin022]HNQ64680.1 OmpH family outer membrane protein [Smithella sp.]HOE33275.1 OmpH family outer membrane protein [Smithella sp.]